MKRKLVLLLFLFVIIVPSLAFAQGMMGSPSSSIDNAAIQSQRQEEQEGKRFLDDLNNKTIACSQLKDADFEKIGEYFMGQAVGDTSRHIAMNEMMKGMMGEKGEEQMHIAWGKRASGCDTSSQSTGFMPMTSMMQMMGSTGSPQVGGGGNPMPALSGGMGYGGWNNMMGGWGGFGWLFMTLFWALVLLGIVALLKWILSSGKTDSYKTPLDILKERYAKGEIDKKEFEEKAKVLSK